MSVGWEELTKAAAVLASIEYRGGSFRLAHMWDDQLGVALDITVDDAFRPGETLQTTRAVAIVGDSAFEF